MTRISHVADIHIRALTRHDEYRKILKFFIDDCKSQNVNHIFVGGDIYHSKTTSISPEYIDLLTWWLNGMAEVAKVHLILGNHDLNLTNLSRRDAVSPIVDAMSNPRIHLYKKSGVYQLEDGFNLCVFSCSDVNGWDSVKPVPGQTNIAAFHGPVKGSTTESEWQIEEGITVDFFDGYDFALLGDIHKPQTLAYRDGKPWMAYPGTPIQQNYAEKIEHGYLLWDIKNSSDWSVVTRALPNLNPFVTIDWQGNLEKTIEEATQFPVGSRFRIRSTLQLKQDETHLLSERLKTSMGAIEVTYKFEQKFDDRLVPIKSGPIFKKDLRSPDVVLQLVKGFHNSSTFSVEDNEKLLSLIKKNLSGIVSTDEVQRGSKWNLRSLRWDNLFSYGTGNVVNFEKLDGIVGIFGPNRTGKSSVVGALMYSLFNTTDRGSMKNIDVCNVRKDYCSAQVVVDHNGITHVVERLTAKNVNRKGVITASTSLNLFRMKDDGTMEDLCREQRNETEKSIRSIFGTSEDFLMTSVSTQGETCQFLEQGSSKRRSMLARYLNLDVFDRLFETSSREISSIKSQLKNFPDRDWDGTITSLKDELRVCDESAMLLETSIVDLQTEISFTRQELTECGSTLITREDVENQRSKIKNLQENSVRHAGKAKELENEISGLRSKLSALEDLLGTSNLLELRKRVESYNRLERSVVELKHVFEKEIVLLEQTKKSMSLLEEVPCGDHFPTCKFIKNAHESKKEFVSQAQKVQLAKNVLEEAEESFSSIKISELDDLKKFERASELRSRIELQVSKCETELMKITMVQTSNATALCEAQEKLEDLERVISSNDSDSAAVLRAKLDRMLDSVKMKDKEKLSIATRRGVLMAQVEKVESEKVQRDSLLAEVRVHEVLSNAFSKKSIPLDIMKTQLPVINSEISKILHGIVDFAVELENDEETDSLEILINYGDSKRIIELCSGMEKTIAAIAIRVALLNITSLPRPNFFVIDEGFGTLDGVGVEACNRLLESLKKYFKTIIVITHIDGIKDAADHILEVTKNEHDSKLELT